MRLRIEWKLQRRRRLSTSKRSRSAEAAPLPQKAGSEEPKRRRPSRGVEREGESERGMGFGGYFNQAGEPCCVEKQEQKHGIVAEELGPTRTRATIVPKLKHLVDHPHREHAHTPSHTQRTAWPRWAPLL